ncbi:pentapeptide repeat-containing protein [Allohahella sp. A8]|uniref:pentapeptide repeat-containing protein n=1 Tax=Allohahella sp. A8 TaxID=3141461 RepID=UPI003A7FB257
MAGPDEWTLMLKRHKGPKPGFHQQHFRSPKSDQTLDFRKHTFSSDLDSTLTFTDCEFFDPVDFSGVHFGAGSVDFSRSVFHRGVNFKGVRFEGEVMFRRAKFLGNAHFRSTHFQATPNFSDATFCGGRVEFSDAQFRATAIFQRVKFQCGLVDFAGAKFVNSVMFDAARFSPVEDHDNTQSVDFSKTELGDGEFSFQGAMFNGSRPEARSSQTTPTLKVDFRGMELKASALDFKSAQFSWTRLDLSKTTLQARSVSFDEVRGAHSDIVLDGATIAGALMFTPEHWAHGSIFSLRDVVIEGQLTISKLSGQLVPDLRGTRLSHPLDIHLDCYSRREFVTTADSVPPDSERVTPEPRSRIRPPFRLQKWAAPYRVCDANDAARFRRLKILATEAGDHRQALDFNAKEQRAGYWHSTKGWRLVLHGLYDGVSGYGQYVRQPLVALLKCTFLFFLLYLLIGVLIDVPIPKDFDVFDKLAGALDFAIAQVVPFHGANTDARKTGAELLFGNDVLIPWYVNLLAISQAIISVILLFLVGLGLRNLFRLR